MSTCFQSEFLGRHVLFSPYRSFNPCLRFWNTAKWILPHARRGIENRTVTRPIAKRGKISPLGPPPPEKNPGYRPAFNNKYYQLFLSSEKFLGGDFDGVDKNFNLLGYSLLFSYIYLCSCCLALILIKILKIIFPVNTLARDHSHRERSSFLQLLSSGDVSKALPHYSGGYSPNIFFWNCFFLSE